MSKHTKVTMIYKHLIRPVLFLFNAETAHKITFFMLTVLSKIPFADAIVRMIFRRSTPSLEREVFGLKFANPVGLAGGLDKNGEHYNELSDFGFSFIEIGSLTPLPQDGNPKPRLFRIPKDRAIVNHMGINNKGVKNAIEHMKSDRPRTIIAANIARNTITPDEKAGEDYEKSFAMLYDFVDMFVINISCPNVEGLVNLQDVTFLSDIMDNILDTRAGMEISKPILLKLSPDLPHEQLDEIVRYCLTSGIDGIVAGNTTKTRDGLTLPPEKVASYTRGGMSGAPLYQKSLAMVKYINKISEGRLPIVGCGGIMSPQQAKEMLDAGASLIEVYTGFIYEGPGLVRNIVDYLEESNTINS